MAGSDLYVGTLDLLILKAVSWGPIHGYGIGRWIRQTTDDVLTVQEGRCIRPCTGSSARAGWTRTGASPRPVGKPSTTG